MEIKGLKIAFLGDSITEGVGASSPDKVYHSLLKERCGLSEAINYGISGTRIARQKKTYMDAVNWDRTFLSRVPDIREDVDAVVVFGGVVPLAVAGDDILTVKLEGGLVQLGLGFEVTDLKGDTLVLEAVAEHGKDPVTVSGVVEGIAEAFVGIHGVLKLKAFPRLGLGAFYKVQQRSRVQPQLGIVRGFIFDIAASLRQQESFDIGFKPLF